MEWYYTEAGERQGPLGDEEFDSLVRSGRVTLSTLVWREGMADWLPLEAARSIPPTAPVSGQTRCVECQELCVDDNVITIDGQTVCSGCKPVVLQRLREGLHTSNQIARNGRHLVAAKGARLPDRCLKCNAPSTHSFRKLLRWHSSWVYILVLVNLLIFVIVALCVQKKAEFEFKLCDRHWAVRRRDRTITVLTLIFGVTFFIGGIIAVDNSPWVLIVGVGMLLFAGLYGIIRAPTVTPVKITEAHAFIKGAGEEYLEEFPNWEG